MGSVYKKGKYWWIRWDLPPTVDGKRRERKKSCKGMTRAEAKTELTRIESEVRQGIYADDPRMSVAEYLDRWIRDSLEGRVRPNTCYIHGIYVNRYIKPTIGHIALSKLTPLHVQDMCQELAEKKSRTGGKLAPKTIRNIHGVLHAALEQAVRWRLISYNPADGVALPRRRRPDTRAATAEEIAAILREAEKSEYRLPILVALLTGMRRSEILGLRWDDLDERRCIIWVRRSIGYAPGSGAYVDETKTYAGDRAIIVSQGLMDELREHHKMILRRASDPSDPYEDSGWIFADALGNILPPAYLGKAFRRVADNAGVDLTIHELRHTHVTVLIDAGILDKTVSERVGHSDVAVTKGIYTHVSPEMQQPAVEAMDRFVEEARRLADL